MGLFYVLDYSGSLDMHIEKFYSGPQQIGVFFIDAFSYLCNFETSAFSEQNVINRDTNVLEHNLAKIRPD